MRRQRYFRNFAVGNPGDSGLSGLGGRPPFSWREVQPLLLRSAGVVGLAGLVVAVVSSDFMFDTHEAPRAAPATVIQASAEAAQRPLPDDAPNGMDAALLSPQPSGEEAQFVLRRTAEPPAAAAPERSDPVAAAPPPERSQPASASDPVEEALALRAQPAEAPVAAEPTPPEPMETAMVTPQMLLHGALPPDMDLVAPAAIPRARPEPPPAARKKVSQASSSGKRRAKKPSGPPPNCGSKHAYWRYVKNTPTWYCR